MRRLKALYRGSAGGELNCFLHSSSVAHWITTDTFAFLAGLTADASRT